MNLPIELSLVIGAVALPAFAEALLWLLHKLGVGTEWDQIAGFVVAIAFAVLVVTQKVYPQFDQVIVGSVTFLYTLLMALQKVLSTTAQSIRIKLAR